MTPTNGTNTATLLHLSTLTQYFIPFGNYIFPILIWSSNKDKSEFIDYNGKQVLNFQLSLLLYSLVLAVIAVPILITSFFSSIPSNVILNEAYFENHFSLENITGIVIIALVAILLLASLKVAEFFLIIYASIKASNGEKYKYPLTIPFLK